VQCVPRVGTTAAPSDPGDAQGGGVSQPEGCALVGPQPPRNRTDPPTPLGVGSLGYPVFTATGRRLLVVIVVVEATVLTEDRRL